MCQQLCQLTPTCMTDKASGFVSVSDKQRTRKGGLLPNHITKISFINREIYLEYFLKFSIPPRLFALSDDTESHGYCKLSWFLFSPDWQDWIEWTNKISNHILCKFCKTLVLQNHLEIYNYQHDNKIFRFSSLAKLRNGPSLLNARDDKKKINNIQFRSFYCKYFVENGSFDSNTAIFSILRPKNELLSHFENFVDEIIQQSRLSQSLETLQ